MRLFFLSLLLIALCGCAADEAEFRPFGFDPPIITGYYLTDITGLPLGVVGQPNVKGNLTIYPNPARDLFSIHTQPAQEVWIVPAVFMEGGATWTSSDLSATSMYAGNAPVLHIQSEVSNIRVETHGMDDGFYRVYVKVGDEIFYDNLVVDADFRGGF